MKIFRKVVKIDEEKCDGCGLCVPSCAEGAIKVIDGKARLVSEVYCDGLGACLGECPQGAITIEEREAELFNKEAVSMRLKSRDKGNPEKMPGEEKQEFRGCPGSLSRMLQDSVSRQPSTKRTECPDRPSLLGNWPVQIALAPLKAPYYDSADLLVSADCVSFAFADFHERFLAGKTLLVGCPKLDDSEFYLEKLTRIFEQNNISSVEVVFMEVPCCFGLVNLVKLALERAEKSIPAAFTRVSLRGEILES